MVEQPTQSVDSGSNPTRPLHILEVPRSEIDGFIQQHHYSHNTNGITSTVCFGVYDLDRCCLVGASVFGVPATKGVLERYGGKGKVLELRRLCLLDEVPKNSESWFIGFCLRWIRRNMPGIEAIVSYADANYGHKGTIYKATNFQYLGTSQPSKMIEWNSKLHHKRLLHPRRRDRNAEGYTLRLREALESGEAKWVLPEPKHIYLYRFRTAHNV